MHYLDELAKKLVAAQDDAENRHAWIAFRDRESVMSIALRQVLEIEISKGRLHYSLLAYPPKEDVPSQSLSA